VFSSEVGAGSREENASNEKMEPRSDSIGTEKAPGRHYRFDLFQPRYLIERRQQRLLLGERCCEV
jgi:hypothetical protein